MTDQIEQTEDRLFQIAESNMIRLDREFAKLNRRADKLGCPHVGYEIRGHKMVRDPYIVASLRDQYGQHGAPIPQHKLENIPLVKLFDIEVLGEGPKVEGYKFVGTLDHYTIPGKVIVNTVPGEVVPEQFFDSDAICHHCDKIRNRVETFVVEREEDGAYLQVGRNCLKDFFGHDPMAVARWLNRVMHFVTSLGEEDEGWGNGGGRVDHYYNAAKVLTNMVAVIRTYGYVSKKVAQFNEDKTATSNDVRWIMSRATGKEKEQQRRFIATILFEKEKDLAEAEAAVAWLKEQTADNEYMHNLKLLEDEDHIPSKMFGYWSSLVPTYQRAMDRLELARIERENSLNEHLGEVGQRVEGVHVRCTGVQSISGQYGVVNIHRMKDSDGRSLVWFANSARKMEKGNEYIIRAGVKKHDEYKDWAQTILTRVNVTEEIETEKDAA